MAKRKTSSAAPKKSAPKKSAPKKSATKKSDPSAVLQQAIEFRAFWNQVGAQVLDKSAPKITSSAIKPHLAKAKAKIDSVVLGTGKKDLDIGREYATSSLALQGYNTLDFSHVDDLLEISESVTCYADDPTRDRPLNILMLASPGAGKSHFIKCLADGLKDKDIRPITYNMTAMERNEDLIHPLDTARNLKVADKLPLLFLDEFDSDPRNYAVLLPLLWDGEAHLGHRDLKLGKIIIVLAGSKPEVPRMMQMAQNMELKADFDSEKTTTKIVDLLSRINGGVVEIPRLDLVDEERDRRIDKVCVALSLLQKRFGQQLTKVPRSFLRFIATAHFRYGVRSIAHLIDVIPHKNKPKVLSRSSLKLPLGNANELKNSSLAYHLIDEERSHGIIAKWKDCVKYDAEIDFQPPGGVNIAISPAKPTPTDSKRSK